MLTDADTGASGWSIADAARWKETTPNPGSWAAESDGESMSIRVNGEVGPTVDTTAPTVTSIVRQDPDIFSHERGQPDLAGDVQREREERDRGGFRHRRTTRARGRP